MSLQIYLHSRVTKIIPPSQAKAAAAKIDGRNLNPQDVVGVIDHSTVVSQRLSTTLRVPLNRYVLIGGMTFDTEPGQPGDNLYLFMSAAVQELLDDGPANVVEPRR